MKRILIVSFSVIYLSVLFLSCDKSPLFNIIGEEGRSSQDFVINPPLNLDDIKRIGSVYGSPLATADSSFHNGIDIGGDFLAKFIACSDGVVIMINESRAGDCTAKVKYIRSHYSRKY